MKVILSIKPEFAEKIFEGTKRFEFRRSIFKNKNIETIIVYASSPVQKVIGEFDIENIINDEIDELWSLTHDYAGISEEYFYSYFQDKEKGFAIKIKEYRKYKSPKCLKKDFNLTPPQSFLYYE